MRFPDGIKLNMIDRLRHFFKKVRIYLKDPVFVKHRVLAMAVNERDVVEDRKFAPNDHNIIPMHAAG